MSPFLVVVLITVVLVLLGAFSVSIYVRLEQRCDARELRTGCRCRLPPNHTGRHTGVVTIRKRMSWGDPRTPSGRLCPHHGMSDEDLDDYEECFDVPERKK